MRPVPALIRDRIIEQARAMIANNGASYVVLASSHDGLVDRISHLADLGFPVLTEYIPIEPEEPNWSELAEFGVTRTNGPNPDDDPYVQGSGDWPD